MIENAPTRVPVSDRFSRTAKILVDSGQATLDDAETILQSETIGIVAGPDVAQSRAAQTALLTAVNLAARAVGDVPVVIPPNAATASVRTSWFKGERLSDAVRVLGGHIVPLRPPLGTFPAPTLFIAAQVPPGWRGPCLTVTWQSWVGHVSASGERLAEDDAMSLAPVTAAAIAVAESFQYLRGRPEAAYRDVTLDLWSPLHSGHPDSPGRHAPPAIYAPHSWALIGLGHLGQANAWCVGLLPYVDPGECLIELIDDDVVDASNATTGALIHTDSIGVKKTRVVAAALDGIGFDTTVVELRIDARRIHQPGEPEVALVGVDRPEPRKLLTSLRYPLAVDAGLGTGAVGYTGITINSFPGGRDSHAISAWSTTPAQFTNVQDAPDAYRSAVAAGADACGLLTLANKSAAAAFVGMTAAALTVSEPLRRLHQAESLGLISLDLARPGSVRTVSAGAPTTLPAHLRLRT